MCAENLQAGKPLAAAPPPVVGLRPALLVFHIDDNTDDQVLFQAACKHANVPFQWHIAESADRAISYLTSLVNLSQKQAVRWPDLVILELVIPGGGGLKVLEFIRTTPKLKPLPVIILTGHPSPHAQESALKLGANAFYEKPADFSQLVQFVQALYDIWSAARRPQL